ncbi:MAG: HEAT repeat domain-containing protein [Gemmatales bacterium]
MIRLLLLLTLVFSPMVTNLHADEEGNLKQVMNDLRTGELVKKRKALTQIIAMKTAAKSTAPLVASLLEKDRDVLVRRSAAEALGVIGADSKMTIAALSKAMKDTDTEVIARASTSISKYGKDAVPVLRQALAEKDNQVRKYAADALASIGPDAKEAVPDLLKAYQAEGPNMRRGNNIRAAYVIALGNIGPDAKEAIPVFEAFLKERNPDRELRRVVTEAMRKINK